MFNGKDGEDYHLCALRLKATLSRNDLLEATTDPQDDSKIDRKVLSISIPSPSENPPRAI